MYSVCCMVLQVPGNIRRAEHFVAFLRRFVLYLKEKLGVNQVETENPTTFLAQLQERLNIDGQPVLLLLCCLLYWTHFGVASDIMYKLLRVKLYPM